jgi:hypothetical protein
MNEELLNSALQLRMIDLNSRDNVLILANAYLELFNREICLTCAGDIRQAYYKINAHLKNPNVMKLQGEKANKYKLKNGVILIHPQTSQMYSNMNLTDEIAEEILAIMPNAIARFDKVAEPKMEVKKDAELEQKSKEPKKSKKEYILESLQSMTLKELKEIAKDKKYPKKEYQSLNKKSIIEYLIGK